MIVQVHTKWEEQINPSWLSFPFKTSTLWSEVPVESSCPVTGTCTNLAWNILQKLPTCYFLSFLHICMSSTFLLCKSFTHNVMICIINNLDTFVYLHKNHTYKFDKQRYYHISAKSVCKTHTTCIIQNHVEIILPCITQK